MIAASVKFDERSLEDLCIAVINLKAPNGLPYGFLPKDVLQSWVLEQVPEPAYFLNKG